MCHHTSCEFVGGSDGSRHFKVLDSGTVDVPERSNVLLVAVFIEGERVSIAVEGAAKLVAAGSHHIGDADILHQFEELAAVGDAADADVTGEIIPLLNIANQVGVCLGAGIFCFPVDKLVRGNGDIGIGVQDETVALYGFTVHGIDVTIARVSWSDVREINGDTCHAVVRRIVDNHRGDIGRDTVSKGKGEYRFGSLDIQEIAAYSRRTGRAAHGAIVIVV